MYTEDEKDKEDESSIGAWYSYYKGIESHVQLYDKDLLVYRIDYNEYTGGAHGIYMATYLNMDLTLMRPLRLDDIFVGDYKDALTDLISVSYTHLAQNASRFWLHSHQLTNGC